MEKALTNETICKIFANPFYCLGEGINEIFVMEHQALVSEDEFVQVGVNLIKEIGAEKYIRLILENLKGNYTTGEALNGGVQEA